MRQVFAVTVLLSRNLLLARLKVHVTIRGDWVALFCQSFGLLVATAGKAGKAGGEVSRERRRRRA
jgi:hypothetical protein